MAVEKLKYKIVEKLVNVEKQVFVEKTKAEMVDVGCQCAQKIQETKIIE